MYITILSKDQMHALATTRSARVDVTSHFGVLMDKMKRAASLGHMTFASRSPSHIAKFLIRDLRQLGYYITEKSDPEHDRIEYLISWL